eukprot:CAMPEP_0194132632 /NCGR_PEP_ID=MMETSP0152-20130528/3052_1 /TAXON_ID=1049557 /ORGANISM="Thalassiothrix antarctica, Strain L6-D1" /LENGTH=308 /DNA_ID=CAMNT_0038827741 /DNA_START=54 /DNA_END=980 /DNA_ORIENTATION=-
MKEKMIRSILFCFFLSCCSIVSAFTTISTTSNHINIRNHQRVVLKAGEILDNDVVSQEVLNVAVSSEVVSTPVSVGGIDASQEVLKAAADIPQEVLKVVPTQEILKVQEEVLKVADAPTQKEIYKEYTEQALKAATTRTGGLNEYDLLTPEEAVVRRASDVIDYDMISLVVGQENYGLAIVCLGEAAYTFFQAPSLQNGLRVFIPTGIAALGLVFASGPMVTSGDPAQISTGLAIATVISFGLGASYVLRLLAPVSDTPKEIAAVGLLISLAGFFSFAQNLIVDGFVTVPSLPALPSVPVPTLPSFYP